MVNRIISCYQFTKFKKMTPIPHSHTLSKLTSKIFLGSGTLSCGSYSRAGLIYKFAAILQVSFEGVSLSRAGLFQGFMVSHVNFCANPEFWV